MRFCLVAGFAALAGAALAAGPDAAVRSVVRTDARTGRLVRTVKAAPAVVRPAVEKYIDEAALRYDVDPLLVHSLIQVESDYNPLAVSPKGAEGLMQLMPGTARRLAVKDSLNPLDNIDGGVRYLRYLLTLFGEDSHLAVAAYNAGEGAVMKYGDIPPYPETAAYVKKVDRKLGEARKTASGGQRKPPAYEHPPLRQYVDSEGRVHLETQPAP
jgi:soluble lytic murein transglycosylase-like protein